MRRSQKVFASMASGRIKVIGSIFALALMATVSAPRLSAQVDPDLALYNDDAIFQQLSSGGQARLIAKFGPKTPLSPTIVGSTSVSALFATPNNVLVNNPALDTTVNDTQSESSLVLGAGSVIVSAYNNSRFVAGNHFTGFARSIDGGLTFNALGAPPASPNGDSGDPVLARDTTSGTIYLGALMFIGSGMQCFRSFDNGATFTAPVNCAPGTTAF